MVLDCIDSWSLPSYSLLLLGYSSNKTNQNKLVTRNFQCLALEVAKCISILVPKSTYRYRVSLLLASWIVSGFLRRFFEYSGYISPS